MSIASHPAVPLLAVFAAVHHAEVVAHRVGEPFGTLVLRRAGVKWASISLSFFSIATAIATALMFVSGPMASYTVGNVCNAFFAVLGEHIGRRVLVAAVAGVAAVVVGLVAGVAGSVVVAVQHKQLVVREGGRLPGLRPMALVATALELSVQTVGGGLVTGIATAQLLRGQGCMVKAGGLPGLGLVALRALLLQALV
jgi:hypothetical protein